MAQKKGDASETSMLITVTSLGAGESQHVKLLDIKTSARSQFKVELTYLELATRTGANILALSAALELLSTDNGMGCPIAWCSFLFDPAKHTPNKIANYLHQRQEHAASCSVTLRTGIVSHRHDPSKPTSEVGTKRLTRDDFR